MDYLSIKEPPLNKKEMIQNNLSLQKQIDIENHKNIQTNLENFYVTQRPASLNEGRVKNKLDKSITNHIVVCGIVKGIKNLILPLRSKFQNG